MSGRNLDEAGRGRVMADPVDANAKVILATECGDCRVRPCFALIRQECDADHTASCHMHLIRYTTAMLPSTPQVLANELLAAPETDYVRICAHWLTLGTPDLEPEFTNNVVVDALVAAAAAHLARSNGAVIPSWTRQPERALESFWHPGDDAFFAWSLAHAPAEFFIRGVIVEADSLVSV